MSRAKDMTLRRNIYVPGKRTFGELFVDGREERIAFTMEPAYTPNLAQVSRSDTAIKAGRYRLVCQNSPKHGLSLRLYDVPGRFDVLVHAGNYDDDTLGCILPGQEICHDQDGVPVSIVGSRLAFRAILEAVMPEPEMFAKRVLGVEGWITIVDDPAKVAKSG